MKFATLLLAISCFLSTHAQIHTIIEGYIAQLPEKTKIFIVPYQLNTNDQRQYAWRDSAVSLDGRFLFDVNKPYEGIYELRISRDTRGGDKILPLYFRNEKINLSSETESFAKIKIQGSQLSRDQNDYLSMLEENNVLESIRSALRMIKEMESKQTIDSLAMDSLKNVVLSGYKKREDLTLAWIDKHPNSEFGPVIYSIYLSGKLTMTELEALLSRLKPEAKTTFIAKDLQQRVNADLATAAGKPAPDFSLKNVEGKPIKLSDLKGKILLLDFWASWCVPCRAENPTLVKLYEKYKNKNFEILSVSLDDKHDAWAKAIKQDKLPWKHASDLNGWDNQAGKLYNVSSVPTNFLIDEKGTIIRRNVKIEELDKELAGITANK